MADWNLPASLSTPYADFLDYVKARDLDSAQLFSSAPTNPVANMIRYLRSDNKFQEYLAGVWTDKVISLAGGGTGAGTAAAARTNLGIGSMGVQESNNVTITGGTATFASVAGSGSGLTNLNASNLSSGTIPLARLAGITNAEIAVGASIEWAKISKGGSSLAELSTRSASVLDSGTLPDGRFPATLPALSGVNLTNLNGANIASGLINVARLGTGTPDATKFLRGDGSWQVVDVQNIINIQHFTETMGPGVTQKDSTITDVGGVSRATLNWLGFFNNAGVADSLMLQFLNTTTLRANRTSTSGTLTYSVTIITYDAVP